LRTLHGNGKGGKEGVEDRAELRTCSLTTSCNRRPSPRS